MDAAAREETVSIAGPDSAAAEGRTVEIRRWYGREDHEHFDVCADDHCQRYQGVGAVTEQAREAVAATRGRVLTWRGEVCDARYSKCCGGWTERFESAWEDVPVPYLVSVADGPVSFRLSRTRRKRRAGSVRSRRPAAGSAIPKS